MMKKIFFAPVLFFLFLTPQFEALAQSQSTEAPIVFDMTDFPQWARDLRRFDIIAFGTFPFSMFAVTFVTDLFRWYNANGMNFNDLRYAPWPLKSAGAVEMTGQEYQRTILLAAGLSLVLALTDFIIVKIRQNNERRRIESRSSGSFNVNREPQENGGTEDGGGNAPFNIENGEAGDGDAAAFE
jgi:hypothetical protein